MVVRRRLMTVRMGMPAAECDLSGCMDVIMVAVIVRVAVIMNDLGMMVQMPVLLG